MAVTFSDIHTESGLKSLDEYLAGKSYISGDQISKDDIQSLRFPGKATGVRVGAGAGAAAPVEAAPAKEAAGDDDDDDLDLFGDETEEDKKAAEEREKAKKGSSKKKESKCPWSLFYFTPNLVHALV
ncbi:hypothetical protein NC653_004789 [Populus alba x Populus x berolinensis]|uniref:Uncharacterized protein n=1 Tax=Populus alba x Populus x berolinensis TaxID=444605 RepID=A0AAD6RWA5_9ROSI|nr:hypothetical protein NC653_004789 [Populus alba x Populus x berolinensis]